MSGTERGTLDVVGIGPGLPHATTQRAADVVDLLDRRPRSLELVLTGGHDRPDYAVERADLVTEVRKGRHHFDDGVPARCGTEY